MLWIFVIQKRTAVACCFALIYTLFAGNSLQSGDEVTYLVGMDGQKNKPVAMEVTGGSGMPMSEFIAKGKAQNQHKGGFGKGGGYHGMGPPPFFGDAAHFGGMGAGFPPHFGGGFGIDYYRYDHDSDTTVLLLVLV